MEGYRTILMILNDNEQSDIGKFIWLKKHFLNISLIVITYCIIP